MVKFNKAYSIAIAILALIVIIFLAFYSNNWQTSETCNYNDPLKDYIKQNSDCVVNFACIQGTETFKDQCGCGCKKISPTNNTQINGTKGYCDSKSREGGGCIALYKPVCGWANSQIQCIKYPCAETYGNSCEACKNSNVEFWTEGECPK